MLPGWPPARTTPTPCWPGLVSVELQSWQSPAGRAYRTALSLQAAALRRSRTALQEAVAVVLRHAQNVALSPGRPGPDGGGRRRPAPGERPSPPPPVDGMLRIRGGVGGLSFQFEELLAGASALDGIVRELAAVEAEAEAVRRALFPYQSDSYTSGSNAIIAVGEAARALRRVRMELESLGSEVRASHREYEFAEARNTLLLRIGRTGPAYGPLWGLFGLPPVTRARHRGGRGRAGARRGWRCCLACPPACRGGRARPAVSGPRSAD